MKNHRLNNVWALSLLLTAGCGWTGKDGSHHSLIFGVGVVSTKEQTGVSVQERRLAGIVAEHGVSIGVFHQHIVTIDPHTAGDVVISVKSGPAGLSVRNFSVSETNQTTNPIK